MSDKIQGVNEGLLKAVTDAGGQLGVPVEGKQLAATFCNQAQAAIGPAVSRLVFSEVFAIGEAGVPRMVVVVPTETAVQLANMIIAFHASFQTPVDEKTS